MAVFSPLAVAVHGLFFTPFFGAAVAALNWIAVGQSGRAARMLAMGALITLFAALVGGNFWPAYFGVALLFAVVLFLEQSLLREHWPHLPTAGIVSNIILAACFFVAVFTVPALFWLLTLLL